jgi:hypothetical protein
VRQFAVEKIGSGIKPKPIEFRGKAVEVSF